MSNKIVSVETALESILKSVPTLGLEKISIMDAYGRIIHDDIISDINIPPFNNSAMDGYAILYSDTKGASKDNPVKLRITGEIKAGDAIKNLKVLNGTAVRIMTGSPVPQGADAVIQIEDTSEQDDTLNIFREAQHNENIRFAGEDIMMSSTVFQKGHRLKSADIGILASLNFSSVRVHKRPRVAIIATGDELVELGKDLKSGQIRNSNAYSIYSEVIKCGGLPAYLGVARDTIKATRQKLNKAMKYDIIITTGGVSMGKYDFVSAVMAGLGIEIVFEGVKMKPGKPCIFGKKNDRLFFGLPGNPVSAMVSFSQFVRPAIIKMMGGRNIEKPLINAVLKKDIKKKSGRTNFIRGYFTIENGELFVSTTGPQSSGILKSISDANCLIVLPPDAQNVSAGEKVPVQLLHHEEI